MTPKEANVLFIFYISLIRAISFYKSYKPIFVVTCNPNYATIRGFENFKPVFKPVRKTGSKKKPQHDLGLGPKGLSSEFHRSNSKIEGRSSALCEKCVKPLVYPPTLCYDKKRKDICLKTSDSLRESPVFRRLIILQSCVEN